MLKHATSGDNITMHNIDTCVDYNIKYVLNRHIFNEIRLGPMEEALEFMMLCGHCLSQLPEIQVFNYSLKSHQSQYERYSIQDQRNAIHARLL
jgi:hypothetical protein